MKPMQLGAGVLGLVLLLVIVGGLLSGPSVEGPPLDGGTTGTSSATAASNSTSTASPTAQPSVAPAPAPGPGPSSPGNGSAQNGGGDVVPVPDPGTVRFTFTLPAGTAEPKAFDLVIRSAGDAAEGRPGWTRRAGVSKRAKQPYVAILDRMPPGSHLLRVDAPGLGTWGTIEVKVVAGETLELELRDPVPPQTLTVSATDRASGRPTAFRVSLATGDGSFSGERPAEGSVDLQCLPKGYLLRVTADGCAPVYRSVKVVNAPVAVQVVLEPEAQLALKLTNRAGEPSTQRYVRLVGAEGYHHARWLRGPQAGRRFMAIGGKLDLREAPLGRWEVEVSTTPRDSRSWKRLGAVLLESGTRTTQAFTVDD